MLDTIFRFFLLEDDGHGGNQRVKDRESETLQVFHWLLDERSAFWTSLTMRCITSRILVITRTG